MSPTLLLGLAAVLSVSANPLPAHEASGRAQVAVPQDLTTSARTLARRPQVTSLIVPSPKTDPFSKLFRAADLTKRGQPAVALPLPPKSIKCGMTIWQVDPGVDPGIHLPTLGRDVEFKIRSITPPACRE